MSDLEKTILKWLVVIVAMPVAWPFFKALWEDLNKALREDGGVFGRPPLPRELDEIRREAAQDEDPLVQEERFRGSRGARRFRDTPATGDGARKQGREGARGGAGARGGRGRVEGGRRPGFR